MAFHFILIKIRLCREDPVDQLSQGEQFLPCTQRPFLMHSLPSPRSLGLDIGGLELGLQLQLCPCPRVQQTDSSVGCSAPRRWEIEPIDFCPAPSCSQPSSEGGWAGLDGVAVPGPAWSQELLLGRASLLEWPHPSLPAAVMPEPSVWESPVWPRSFSSSCRDGVICRGATMLVPCWCSYPRASPAAGQRAGSSVVAVFN